MRRWTEGRAGLAVAGLALAAWLVLAPGETWASCSGVDHQCVTSGAWEVDAFYEPGTAVPKVVTLVIDQIANNTTVQVAIGGVWTSVGAGTYSGAATRFSAGGAVHIAYTDGLCSEDVQPHD